MTRLILAAMAVGSLTLPAAGAVQTTTASKSSQKPVTGSPSAKTATGTSKKSGKSGKSSSRKSRVKGQAAPTPDRINEIQDALEKNGAYTGTPSGKWDDSTVEAMKKFQATHGLNPSGKMDALTLQKLGLGSDTAGMGVPTPPPNSSNRLLSSKVQRDEVKNEPE